MRSLLRCSVTYNSLSLQANLFSRPDVWYRKTVPSSACPCSSNFPSLPFLYNLARGEKIDHADCRPFYIGSQGGAKVDDNTAAFLPTRADGHNLPPIVPSTRSRRLCLLHCVACTERKHCSSTKSIQSGIEPESLSPLMRIISYIKNIYHDMNRTDRGFSLVHHAQSRESQQLLNARISHA